MTVEYWSFTKICVKAGYTESRVKNWTQFTSGIPDQEFPVADVTIGNRRGWHPDRLPEIKAWCQTYEQTVNAKYNQGEKRKGTGRSKAKEAEIRAERARIQKQERNRRYYESVIESLNLPQCCVELRSQYGSGPMTTEKRDAITRYATHRRHAHTERVS